MMRYHRLPFVLLSKMHQFLKLGHPSLVQGYERREWELPLVTVRQPEKLSYRLLGMKMIVVSFHTGNTFDQLQTSRFTKYSRVRYAIQYLNCNESEREDRHPYSVPPPLINSYATSPQHVQGRRRSSED